MESTPLPPSQLGTLLVACADRRGIVAALAQLLHGHGANILSADQHRDETAGQFFQRIQFDASELVTDRGTLERAIGEVAARFEMRVQLGYADQVEKVAIFVSKYSHCLIDLLWRHQTGELPCDIRVVIGNHPDLAGLAHQFGIEFHHVAVDARNKPQQEAAQLEVLRERGIELVVLARYMQILSPAFVRQFPQRIINIHHSFLPAFIGGKPYHQAHERGVKLIGATAHYVTDNLDEGPIIEQDVLRTSHRDSTDDLVRKGRDVERAVLSRAVRWHLERRLLVWGNKTVVFE
jgi:formyltetrahydrofolate deformylase